MSIRRVVSPVLLLLCIAVFACPAMSSAAAEPTLNPTSITKYVTPLVIPPAMPYATQDSSMTTYNIAVKQFQQQILPAGMPKTTVWSYGDASGPAPGAPGSSFNYPAFTVETRSNALVRVKWINGLVDAEGNYLPHLLPVDPTLHWANPPGPRDHKPEFIDTPGRYTGPVPIVTHVHGSHVPAISDGYPEAWFLPDAKNIPAGYFTRGTFYDTVLPAEAGAAWYEYTNTQRATTLWYHDHTLGMTRLNVYAGPAGFWLIRDAYEDSLNLPGPAPRLGDPAGTKYYEIPIVIQDRSFNSDGSLFYPDSRRFFEDYPEGPFNPGTTVSPIWNPEFFGNTIVVNGSTWPYLDVEPRKYRLRLLNGCNTRFLILKVTDNPLRTRPVLATFPFHQIGNEGGLIPNGPIALQQLLIAPAERADVIVDFSTFAPGTELYMINDGPDEPFGGLPVDTSADSQTTGQVMKFRVVASTGADTSSLPAVGTLAPMMPLFGPVAKTRDLTLNEIASMPEDVPSEAHLGTGPDGPMGWAMHMTEMPMLGDTEIWRLINLTADAHPIHLHLVMFEVLGRIPFNTEGYKAAQNVYINAGKTGTPPDPLTFSTGPLTQPNSWERGTKDTVIVNPGEMTMVKAVFDYPGLYVWHCHILEHEDNEMMRPYRVVEDQCGSYAADTNSIHVPCVDFGDTYSMDLPVVSVDPLRFGLTGLINLGSGMGGDQCATLNLINGVLHLPCVNVQGTRYSANFTTVASGAGSFELLDFAVLP